MVELDIAPEEVIELTPKGKVLHEKVKFMPFVRYVSLVKSLYHSERTFADLQNFNKKHLLPHLSAMLKKGYIKVRPVPARNYKSTDIELVKELTELNKNGRYDTVIKNAASGRYHDLKSSSDWPKELLLNDLAHFYELDGLLDRIRAGEFNEAPIKAKTGE